MNTYPAGAKLSEAAKWVRATMKARLDGQYTHPSHVANEVLAEAEKRFCLDSYGVDGWSTSTQSGYQYLNFGDSYAPTIVVFSSRNSWRVSVAMGGWASYVAR